jgi:DNA polymerase-3 subunit gamma/tau
MAYVALYRKYRSHSFGAVIGQQHVTTTLQNAIRMGRIAHAYLFCGPRGCGKTSTARLLARALNCQAGESPSPEPCGVCDMCLRIRDGSAMDVIEMDAASETGIDDVREKIIENAKYAPAEARFKVYIIDEVHDLSLKAFDSLLKTIEEPPAHVVFVLATTEAHKVPITIRSRCQRMDFRRATIQDLIRLLQSVLEAEAVAYDPEAVSTIARAAEGSFRDSLSLLEQALAYTDGHLSVEAVLTAVGMVGPEMLDSITRILAADDLQAAYLKAGELVESGKDVKQLLVALQLHLRDLLVAQFAQGPQALTEVTPERFQQLQEQARSFTPDQLLKMLDILADAERDLRYTNQHRLLLERAFWSILPGRLGESGAVAAPVVYGREEAAARARAAARPKPVTETASVVRDSRERAAPPSAESTLPAPPEPVVSKRETEKSAPAAPVEDSRPQTQETDPRFAPTIDEAVGRRVWPRIRQRITQKSRAAAAIFGEEQVLRLEGRTIVLGFTEEFMRSRADRPQARQLIEQMIEEELGVAGFKVHCVLMDQNAPSGAPEQKATPPRNGGTSVTAPVPPALGLLDEMPTEAELPVPAPVPPLKEPISGESAPAGGKRKPKESEEEFLTLVLEEFDGEMVDE